MEILSNFSSIYCFITFIFGAVFMLAMYSIAAMEKDKEPKNKVRFYVKAIEDNRPWLFIQKRTGTLQFIAVTELFADFGLNPLDFYDMKEEEIREVFINLED